MASNALGKATEAAPTDNATRKGAGEGATHDNVKSNAGIQRDGTPTNIGAKPTAGKGAGFFKPGNDGPVSGMEKAMAGKFKR